MANFDVNYLAVLVAGIAAMILAFIWYVPLFGKMWMKLTKIKPKKKGMAKKYFAALIKTWIIAYFLAVFIKWVGAVDMENGLLVGFWLWIGFMATTTYSGVIWGKKPFKLWLLDNAYNLLSMLLMAWIIIAWV